MHLYVCVFIYISFYVVYFFCKINEQNKVGHSLSTVQILILINKHLNFKCIYTSIDQLTTWMCVAASGNLLKCSGSQSVSSKCQRLHISSWCLFSPLNHAHLNAASSPHCRQVYVVIFIYLFFSLYWLQLKVPTKKRPKVGRRRRERLIKVQPSKLWVCKLIWSWQIQMALLLYHRSALAVIEVAPSD